MRAQQGASPSPLKQVDCAPEGRVVAVWRPWRRRRPPLSLLDPNLPLANARFLATICTGLPSGHFGHMLPLA
jgi:hypothetical protein